MNDIHRNTNKPEQKLSLKHEPQGKQNKKKKQQSGTKWLWLQSTPTLNLFVTLYHYRATLVCNRIEKQRLNFYASKIFIRFYFDICSSWCLAHICCSQRQATIKPKFKQDHLWAHHLSRYMVGGASSLQRPHEPEPGSTRKHVVSRIVAWEVLNVKGFL